MNQVHFDTRTLRKAAGPMVVAKDSATAARARAIREGRNGRLVYVCSWCVTDAVKAALADLDNLSHGICTPCLADTTGGAV